MSFSSAECLKQQSQNKWLNDRRFLSCWELLFLIQLIYEVFILYKEENTSQNFHLKSADLTLRSLHSVWSSQKQSDKVWTSTRSDGPIIWDREDRWTRVTRPTTAPPSPWQLLHMMWQIIYTSLHPAPPLERERGRGGERQRKRERGREREDGVWRVFSLFGELTDLLVLPSSPWQPNNN